MYSVGIHDYRPLTVATSAQVAREGRRYGKQQEGSKVLEEAKHPEFKVCKSTTDAIIAEGSDVGTVHKVSRNRLADTSLS